MAEVPSQRLAKAREQLLREISREVRDNRVLEAIRRVPREEFVPADARGAAYENYPLPIGYDQTISQPLMAAMMTEAAQVEDGDRVLEVGTGSGYQAAVLALLADHVLSVERIAPLADDARQRLSRLGFENVEVHATSDDRVGWPAGAPYDVIVVTAASPEVPLELLNQLAMGGRLVIPVGAREIQELVRIVKTPQGAQRHNLGPCRFVPLLGRSGWPDSPRP